MCAAVLEALDLYDAELAPPPPGRRFPDAIGHLIRALLIARTPDVPLPALPDAPAADARRGRALAPVCRRTG